MHPVLARLYWLLTAFALLLHVAGAADRALAAAIGLVAAHVLHAAWRLRRWRALPVQVRIAYLLMLLAGLWPPLAVLHALQLAGLVVLLTADYCLLARTLTLLPWNRPVPLTPALVLWLFTSPPAPGAITARLPATRLREAA